MEQAKPRLISDRSTQRGAVRVHRAIQSSRTPISRAIRGVQK
jgi:hypothetical protein